MDIEEIKEKLFSIKQCMMAHPDNEQDSEFADRISDLEELEQGIDKCLSLNKAEQQLYGYNCGATDVSLRELVSAMGLTAEELDILVDEFEINSYMDDAEILQMYEYIKGK